MNALRHLSIDTRFALRSMRQSPAFFATLIGILTLGIGVTTAVFSIVDSLLLRPLPYPRADRLTVLTGDYPASVPDFLDWKAQASSFERMAAVGTTSASMTSGGGLPEHYTGARVTGDFFPMLGLAPLQGRLFGPDDDRAGGPRVAVVSAAVFRERFGADPGLVGRTIALDGEPHTVVGVAPEGFRFSEPRIDRCDVWIAGRLERPDGNGSLEIHRAHRGFAVIGRRKPGVTLEQAQAEISVIGKRLEALYPDTNTNTVVRLISLQDALIAPLRPGIWTLFVSVLLVFAIACANVANLLLTRAETRRFEMAARAALGATKLRLTLQSLTETSIVFLLSALSGSALAHWLVDAFASGIIHGGGAFTIEIRVDAAALFFSILVGSCSGLLFGTLPAFVAARADPRAALQESSTRAGTSRFRRRVQAALVVIQVAFASALLVAGGLTLRAFARLAATPPGFDPENVATANLTLSELKYADDAQLIAFYSDLLGRVIARPEVQSAAVGFGLPMSGWALNGTFEIEGRPPFPRGAEPPLGVGMVTPGFFRTLGIPILRGRDFNGADRRDGRAVMILNESAAKAFFPSEDALGKRLDWTLPGDEVEHLFREIVGVVGDVRGFGLERAPDAMSYVPLEQRPFRQASIVARSASAPALLGDLPALVGAADPDQAVVRHRLLADLVAGTIRSQRYVAWLLAGFALAAFALAGLGVFGVVSYATSQRTREIGIRMALGATPNRVVGDVLWRGARPLVAGLALGMVGAVFAGRILASRIDGVRPFELAVFALVPVILGAVGLLASFVPARRAVRIPPSSALRCN